MRRFVVLIFCCLVAAGCSKVETASKENAQINPTPIPAVSPTAQLIAPLKAVVPKVKLNSKQMKELDTALPLSVREVLEKAEKFEVLREDNGRDAGNEGTTFEPNRVAVITDENLKKEILESFYADSATDEPPANCYTPRHSLRAKYDSETVEIEICFECARFDVKSSFGDFFGTIRREKRESEDVFNRIIESQSVELK